MAGQPDNGPEHSSMDAKVVGRSASGTPLIALPPPPEGFAGTSQVKNDNYILSVSNKEGYLSHIIVDALFNTTPENIFALFTHADNTTAFRDIKSVAGRKVVESDGKRTVVEVEQIGEMQVLWMKKTFSTCLRVVEDASDPNHMVIIFELLKSDVLARFHGRWDLEPEVDSATNTVKCRSKLTQDVSPMGVPPFFAHIPVLGGLLRGIGVRASKRIVEDVNSIVAKLNFGQTLDQIFATPKTTKAAKTSTPQKHPENVNSFAIDEEDEQEGNSVEDTPATFETTDAKAAAGTTDVKEIAQAAPKTTDAEEIANAAAEQLVNANDKVVSELVKAVQDAQLQAAQEAEGTAVMNPDVSDKVHEAAQNLEHEAGINQAAQVAA